MFVGIKSGGFFNFLSEDFKGLFVYGVDRLDFLGLWVLDGVPGDLDIEWPDFYQMKRLYNLEWFQMEYHGNKSIVSTDKILLLIIESDFAYFLL